MSALVLVCTVAGADEKDQMKRAMEAAAKYATPDEHHQRLEKMAGTWTAAGRFWMAPGRAIENTAVSEKKMIFGGRYLVEEFKGTFLGQPFSGHGVTGYDLTKQKYTWFWIDSMATWMIVSEGTADASGRIITTTSREVEPQTGKQRLMRYVTRIDSDQQHVVEFYNATSGKDVKVAEIVYTRK